MSLKKGERPIAMCFIAISVLAGVIVYLYFDNKTLRKENTELQNDKIALKNDNIACEKEKTEIVKKFGQDMIEYRIEVNNEVKGFMQEKIDELKKLNHSNDSALRAIQQVKKRKN